jgi:hypothetical protein
MTDQIKNPKHYTKGKIQVWDFIIDQGLGFLSANIIKYICRFRWKGTALADLKKAKAYLDKLISEVEKREKEKDDTSGFNL